MTVEQNVLQQHSQKVSLLKLTWGLANISFTVWPHSCRAQSTRRETPSRPLVWYGNTYLDFGGPRAVAEYPFLNGK